MIKKTDFIYKKQIGCNEVATILLADKKKSRLQLYLEKTGQHETVTDEVSDFIESTQQNTTAYLWKHYNNKSFFENRLYYANDKCDWLVSNPKKFILTGNKRTGILRCGTTESLVVDVLNVRAEMIVHEIEHAEIAYVEDGKLIVNSIELDEYVVDEILSVTEKFFKVISEAQTILYNLKLAKEANDDTAIKFYSERLNEIEPLPEDTDAYKKFISQRLEVETIEIKKEDKTYDEFHKLALEYLYTQDKLKLVDVEFKQVEAKVLRSMRGSQHITIGDKYEFYQQNGILSLNIK